MSYATRRSEHFRSSTTLVTTTSAHNTTTSDLPTSAPVLDFICLFTHDLRRKNKRWQDGKLKYHTFNKRVMVYDDAGHFIGDAHWPGDRDLCQGEELDLDRGGAIVQVEECVGSRDQDLREVLEKRGRDVEGRREAAAERTLAKTPSKPLAQLSRAAPVSAMGQYSVSGTRPRNPHMIHRPLHSVLRSPGPIGRASVPDKSPFDIRRAAQPSLTDANVTDDRATKRQRVTRSPPTKRQGHAQHLFGTKLNLSATPTNIPLVRSQPLQDATNLQPRRASGETERGQMSRTSRQEDKDIEHDIPSSSNSATREDSAVEQLPSTTTSKVNKLSTKTARVAKRKETESESTTRIAPDNSRSSGETRDVGRHQPSSDTALSSPIRECSTVTEALVSAKDKRQGVLGPDDHATRAKASRSGVDRGVKTGTRKGQRSSSQLSIDSNNDEAGQSQTSGPRKPTAVKPLQKSRNLANKTPRIDEDLELSANGANGHPDASILPPSSLKQNMAREPAQDRGPRAELRIRSRKKRGLLLISERAHPKESKSVKPVKHDDDQIEFQSVPRGAAGTHREEDRETKLRRGTPAHPGFHDNDDKVAGENTANEICASAFVETADAGDKSITRVQTDISPDHTGHRPIVTTVESQAVHGYIQEDRESTDGGPTEAFSLDEQFIGAVEMGLQARPSSSDGSSEGDVGFEVRSRHSSHDQEFLSSPVLETASNMQSPDMDGLGRIQGHGDGPQLQDTKSRTDATDASIPSPQRSTRRNQPRLLRRNTTESNETSLEQPPDESSTWRENPSAEMFPPRMRLKKMGSKSTRCREIIGWILPPNRSNMHSCFETVTPIAVDAIDETMERVAVDTGDIMAEQTKAAEDCAEACVQMLPEAMGPLGVTNSEAASPREHIDLNCERRSSPSAEAVGVSDCNCSMPASGESGVLGYDVGELPEGEDEANRDMLDVAGSVPEKMSQTVTPHEETSANANLGNQWEGAEETDTNHSKINATRQVQDSQSIPTRNKGIDRRDTVLGGVRSLATGQRGVLNSGGQSFGIGMGGAQGFSWASNLPKDILFQKETKGRKRGVAEDPSQRPFSFKPVHKVGDEPSEKSGEQSREKRPKAVVADPASHGGAWSKHAFDLLGMVNPRTA